jgi:voltage-gated potassium channel Kch
LEDLSSLIAIAGTALVLIVLVDVFLTVLHINTDGPVATATFLGVWRSVVVVSRLAPRARRALLALAGPTMIVVVFGVWITLFILGFALIYWPFVDLLHFNPEPAFAGFLHALYFSGVTATVLGYGDITPVSPVLMVVSFLQSGLGFALLTSIVTYLISIVTGVSERNALALRLWVETDRSGDGVVALARWLPDEEPADVRSRLQGLVRQAATVQQKMQHFPILDLFYRSRESAYSPEDMIKAAAEIALAARIIAGSPAYRRLRPLAGELGGVVSEMIDLLARQYMSVDARRRLREAVSEPDDERRVDGICKALRDHAPGIPPEHRDGRSLELAARLRLFLDETDILTGRAAAR